MDVMVFFQNWWVRDAVHVNPIVGVGVKPARLCLWPVTLNTSFFCSGFTVCW